MSTLLTLPAAAFPLLWAKKLSAALVLFAVCAANVVVATTEFPASHMPVQDRSSTKAHKFLRHICPQERSCRGLALAFSDSGGRTPPRGFLGTSLELSGTEGVYGEIQTETSIFGLRTFGWFMEGDFEDSRNVSGSISGVFRRKLRSFFSEDNRTN